MVTLQEARKVIGAAEKKAIEIGQPMNIAVVDEGGNLISHVRMDGAWIGSIDISINKAFTSRAFDISTRKAKSSYDCAPILYIVCSWQSEMKGRPTYAVRARPQTASLRLDDRAANRQPHPAALWLGRKKRLENLI